MGLVNAGNEAMTDMGNQFLGNVQNTIANQLLNNRPANLGGSSTTAPTATPDTAPDATPDAAPDATPDAAPDAAPEATPSRLQQGQMPDIQTLLSMDPDVVEETVFSQAQQQGVQTAQDVADGFGLDLDIQEIVDNTPL